MDNQPNNLGEEPPMQQTPDMLNQQQPQQPQEPQPAQPQTPHDIDATPPERPPEGVPKKKKTGLIVLVVIIVLIILGIIVGTVHWFAVLRDVNEVLDEQNGTTQIVDEHGISNVDELMAAYETNSALNCNYVITMEGETFDVSEQANDGWQAHKITTIGIDSSTTTLVLDSDTVYSWGWTSGSKEFAIKMSWDKLVEIQDSELAEQFNTEQAITDSKDSISGLICYAIDPAEDFSVPTKEWTDVTAMLDALTSGSLETLFDEYSFE